VTEPLLSVRDLAVHFATKASWADRFKGNGGGSAVKALDGVHFHLREGETLGIVGESGCGKTTLARAVLGLVESSRGEIRYRGRELSKLGRGELHALRREVQMVFQDPLASLDPRMTAGDIVAEPLKTHEPRRSREEVRRKVRDMLAKVGLQPEMINRYPHEFSGGQCQRIGIARAMVLAPRLVVCDEPVSALDVSIQAQILRLLTELQRESGLSLLFISHDLSVVRTICHRVTVLYLGRVMESAPCDILYRRPRHPYTRALLSAVPVPDPRKERARRRILLKGELPSPWDPPSGCVFRTRCFMARPRCAADVPLWRSAGKDRGAACHFLPSS